MPTIPLRLKAAALWCFLVLAAAATGRASEPRTVPGRYWVQAASPADLGWSVEQLDEARRFSDSLDTAGLMIVQEGIVVDQWGQTALPLKCHSVRKSLLSALYGPHVESGTIDLDRTLRQLGINDNEPSLTDVEREARIRDLLTARSGIYHPALYETRAMAARRPERGSHEPDTFWYYNNWDFNAAGSIFENLTARSLFEEFEDRLAGPLGMEDFVRSRHTQYVTGRHSVHPAYPFELSTRDLARFGLLYLHEGRWGDRQLIPADWVHESTASYSETGGSGGYGYMWWVAADGKHFPGVELPEGTYSARGNRGQYLVVIPDWDLVICHRVNSFQSGTEVSKTEFGRLLSLIVAARPATSGTPEDGRVSSEADGPANTARPVISDTAEGGRVSSEADGPANTTPGLPAGQTRPRSASAAPEYDVIIRGGEVIDGTGGERFRADVALRSGRVARVGMLGEAAAQRVIDAAGKLVVPGFIDLHSHADKGLVSDDPARRSAPNLITQGITTVVVNQDGGGPLDLARQRQTMQRRGTGLNVVQMLGHGTIRREVMGRDHQRPATPPEIERMQELLRRAMAGGAFGLSAGLEYVPGRWSTMREMEALAGTVAALGGVYIVHERSSGSRPMWFLPSRDSADQPSMLDNLRELIEIAGSTNVTTVATHIKARGTDFWGSSARMNELLKQAREDGLPIYADQYPYNTSGSDGRIVLIPSWATSRPEPLADEQPAAEQAGETENASDQNGKPRDFAASLEATLADQASADDLRRDIEYEITRRGGAESILIVEHPDPELVGKTLAEYADVLKQPPVEAALALQMRGDRTRRGGARLRAFSMSEKDVETFAKTPWTATSSDAGIALPDDGPVHPRFYGAFPRKIRRYAIDRKLISIEEAVRVSTSLPAEILRLEDRGVIRPGACADLVVFDPDRIRDRADAFDPHQYADGIESVFVNGTLAVDRQRWLGTLSGQVLTHPTAETDAEAQSQ